MNRERRPFEGGLLLGFDLFEIRQLRFPSGGFVGLIGSFVQRDETLRISFQIRLASYGQSVFALFETLKAGKQKRFGFGVFFCPTICGTKFK